MQKIHNGSQGQRSAGTKDMTVGNPYSLMTDSQAAELTESGRGKNHDY